MIVIIITMLGLVAVAPVEAQIVLRPGTIIYNPDLQPSLPANPLQTVNVGQRSIHLHTTEITSGGANRGAQCTVGQVLSPGQSCTVGSETFQVNSNGSATYGYGMTVGAFGASRISGTNNWRIDSVPGAGSGLRFSQTIADQQFSLGQSITPLVLPEATGSASPISYSPTPALPSGLSFAASTRTISGMPTHVTEAPVHYTYTATDADGATADVQFNISVLSPDSLEFVDIQYDQGDAVGASNGGNHLFVGLPDNAQMSTRFAPKASSGDNRDVRIDRIWLAPYFDNQFSNSSLPDTAPRDMTVYIYSDRRACTVNSRFGSRR